MPLKKIVNYLVRQIDGSLSIPKPQIIFSITGGSENFKIDKDEENLLKSELMKIAKISNTWLISSGIDSDVIRIIGEAADEDENSHNLTLLGITCRNRVYGRYSKLRRDGDEIFDEKNIENLNPYQSCFLFFDASNYEAEIEFRTKFENHLNQLFKIPFFVMAFNGGIGTLKKILNALEGNVPIIMIAVCYHKIFLLKKRFYTKFYTDFTCKHQSIKNTC